MRGQFALAYLSSTAWALEPRYLERYSQLLRGWASGERASAETLLDVRADALAIEARRAAAASVGGGGVRVLPLYGIISSRGNVMNEISGPGSTSTQMFIANLRDALNDDSCGAIVIDIDSPGGSVYQIEEVGNELYKSHSQKPTYGCVNCLCASAAYWIGSQCTHLHISPSGEAGSIGVVAMHEDWSKANEMAGLTPTYIYAGQYKTELNPNEPASEEGLAYQQSRVDDYYSSFIRAVARGRKASVSDVRTKMGQGRVMGAQDAVNNNLCCGVWTFDDTIQMALDAARTGNRASIVVPAINAAVEPAVVVGTTGPEILAPTADPGGHVLPVEFEAAALGDATITGTLAVPLPDPAPAAAVQLVTEPSAEDSGPATAEVAPGLALQKARNRLAMLM